MLKLAEDLSLPIDTVTQSMEWAAGWFEGEGCISHDQYKRGRRRMLSAVSTDLDTLERFQHVVGCGVIVERKLVGNRKPSWKWTVQRWQDVQRVLEAFLPYLLARRKAKALEVLNDPPSRDGVKCPAGHPLVGDTADVYIRKNGRKHCAVCVRAQTRARRAKAA